MSEPVGQDFAKQTCHGRWMSEEYEPGLVSVIIPTYNRAHMVTEAMDSVWAQTYRPIELIVVDDGSIDKTREVVDEWAKKCAKDPQFELRYFYQENRGPSAARNLGLIESKGEFIQYLDSDDLLLPEKLSRQVHLLVRSSHVDYVCAHREKQTSRGRQVGRLTAGHLPGRELGEVIVSQQWLTVNALYRRHACFQVGPWAEDLGVSEDTLQEARLKALGFRGFLVPEVHAVVRGHPGQIGGQESITYALNLEKAARKLRDLVEAKQIDNCEAWNTLARRLVRAGLIFGAEGDSEARKRCLSGARRTARGRYRLLVCAISLLAQLPCGRFVSRIVHKARFLQKASAKYWNVCAELALRARGRPE